MKTKPFQFTDHSKNILVTSPYDTIYYDDDGKTADIAINIKKFEAYQKLSRKEQLEIWNKDTDWIKPE